MKRLLLPVIIATIITLQNFFHPNVFAESIVIANITKTQDRITRDQVRNIFLFKERNWPDGTKITLCRLPEGNYIHRRFVRDVLNLKLDKFEEAWASLVTQYSANAFRRVNTEEKMIACVTGINGAIGYVDADHLIVATVDNTAFKKIVIVDP